MIEQRLDKTYRPKVKLTKARVYRAVISWHLTIAVSDGCCNVGGKLFQVAGVAYEKSALAECFS